MVDLRHFVTLENSIAAPLRAEWGRIARGLADELNAFLVAGQWNEAHDRADKLDLNGFVEQFRPKLEELAVSAFLFGAHHVTGDLETTSLVKGDKPVPLELKAAVNQLVTMIEKDAATYIREAIHEVIQEMKAAALTAQYVVSNGDVAASDLAATGGLLEPSQAPLKKPLYVHRPVINSVQVIAWAKEQGFKTTLPADDLHVTVCFSREPMDWMAAGDNFDDLRASGGVRRLRRFGEAIVLTFENADLERRHQQFADCGASWDHDGYHPHVTISYDPDFVIKKRMAAYDGPIELGPEVYEPVKEDWKDDIKEAVVKADRSLAEALNNAVLGTGKMMIDIGANLTTSRLVSLGFLSQAADNGVTSYQVNEILDDKICPVCLFMHGKEFDVSHETGRLLQTLGTQDPQDLASISPWLKQNKAALDNLYSLSEADLQAAGYGSPPYHPGCRGVIALSGTVDASIPSNQSSLADVLNPLLDGLKGPAELDPVIAALVAGKAVHSTAQDMIDEILPDLPVSTFPSRKKPPTGSGSA